MKSSKILISCALFGASVSLLAQESREVADGAATESEAVVEEVVVLGRFMSAAEALMNERRDDEAVVDVLDAESISRLGDSTVAAALRRVTGVSLVNDKFVYVRGLGERYSTTTLNGAYIPSPDLTRNVIPLDIFPSSVASALKVQKTFSADIPANFAGGLVEVRTLPFPEDAFNFSLEVGSGVNSESDDLLSYAGGKDDDWGKDDGTRRLSSVLTTALDTYGGNLSPSSIRSSLIEQGNAGATTADAEVLNRQLALALNRNVALTGADDDADQSYRASIGGSMQYSDDIELGFQGAGSYDSNWRGTQRTTRSFGNPEDIFGEEAVSVRSVDLNATATVGARLFQDHEISANYLFIRNSDDEVGVKDYFTDNALASDGLGRRDFRAEFEHRELETFQLKGEHLFGFNADEYIPLIGKLIPTDTKVNWIYSDSVAETDIPNQLLIKSNTTVDADNVVVGSVVRNDSSAADFRFTDLEDEVLSYGYDAEVPFSIGENTVTILFGYHHDSKARAFEQREFGLGSTDAGTSTLIGAYDVVFSDVNISDAANGFALQVQESGTASYLAATMTDAMYVAADIKFLEKYRVTVGARHEDYRQVALPYNIYGYSISDPAVTTDTDQLRQASFQESEYYPSLVLGYESDWLAETFQLRLAFSETAIRPDVREVSPASYFDPLTNDLVVGNTDIRPAQVRSIDARADWIFDNGNSVTLSAFSKEISNAIEFFEVPRSDNARAVSVFNVDGTDITGVELEGVYRLENLNESLRSFFVQGNATIQDSETTVNNNAISPTNNERSASGASDYLANLMLGYDSSDGKHTASLIFNIFGERLYRAGRLGSPDEFEQPFNSVDFTYSWYPTDNFTVKLKAQNILDEAVEISANDVIVFAEEPGTSFAVKVKYQY